jgi:hypothetical protein
MKEEEFAKLEIVNDRGYLRLGRPAHGFEQKGRTYFIPNLRAMPPDEVRYLAEQLELAAAAVESGGEYKHDVLRELGALVAPNRQIWVWARIGPSRRYIPSREFVTDEGLSATQARALAARLRAALPSGG